MTDQASERGRVPRMRRVSRARSHHMRPIECFDLLLVGMATSTNLSGASVSHRAMTGMLTKADSRMAWWSTRGSVTMMMRGSLNDRVM